MLPYYVYTVSSVIWEDNSSDKTFDIFLLEIVDERVRNVRLELTDYLSD